MVLLLRPIGLVLRLQDRNLITILLKELPLIKVLLLDVIQKHVNGVHSLFYILIKINNIVKIKRGIKKGKETRFVVFLTFSFI